MEYDDERMAKSIAHAVSPDNSVTPAGLSVETRSESNKVITRIACQREFRTFVATVDDLLFSLSIAEKTLHEIMKLRT
jgi:hypothetical protein